jgi:chromosome segregation ATPase
MAVPAKRIEAQVSMQEHKTLLEERIDHVRSDVADIKKDVRRIDEKMDGVRRELTAEIKAVGSKLEGDIRDLREDNKLLREKIDANHADTQVKFAAMHGQIGETNEKVAGLDEKVTSTNEKVTTLTETVASLSEKVTGLSEKVARLSGMQKAVLFVLTLLTGLVGTLLALALKGAGAEVS